MTMENPGLQQALDASLRFLGPRPRSTREVRQRLRRWGLSVEDIEVVVARLQELGYLDDAAFADFWIENREAFRPRGKRLLAQELRQHGIDTEAMEERLAGLDEEASALRAARRKAQGLAGSAYPDFARIIGGFLRRRGFSYDSVSTVTRRLWAEVSPPGVHGTLSPPSWTPDPGP